MTPKRILDSVTAGPGQGIKSRRDIKLGDSPGVELVMEGNEKDAPMLTIKRAYLVGARLYLVTLTCPQDKQQVAQAPKFLDSFLVSLEPL